jgi:hypothetical protein
VTAALAPIGIGLMAGGQVLGGIAGLQSANANARAAEAEGDMLLRDGVATAERVRNQARMVQGEAVAAQGASGFQLGTGSAIDVLLENAINAEVDIMTARTRGENARAAKRTEAANMRAAGRMALVQGLIGAAASVGMGAASGAFGGGGAAAAPTSSGGLLAPAAVGGGTGIPGWGGLPGIGGMGSFG